MQMFGSNDVDRNAAYVDDYCDCIDDFIQHFGCYGYSDHCCFKYSYGNGESNEG